MHAAVSGPLRVEVSQHWAAFVTMPNPIVTIFDSSSNLPANLGIGGGKGLCSHPHLGWL